MVADASANAGRRTVVVGRAEFDTRGGPVEVVVLATPGRPVAVRILSRGNAAHFATETELRALENAVRLARRLQRERAEAAEGRGHHEDHDRREDHERNDR